MLGGGGMGGIRVSKEKSCREQREGKRDVILIKYIKNKENAYFVKEKNENTLKT